MYDICSTERLVSECRGLTRPEAPGQQGIMCTLPQTVLSCLRLLAEADVIVCLVGFVAERRDEQYKDSRGSRNEDS